MPNAPHRRPLSLRSAASRLAKGFTLIELLVVIAVIALLISILLPALKGARVAAWKAISAGNVRSICQAGAAYQHDNKGSLPIVPTGVPVPQNITAWITWGGWGKCASMAWRPPRAPSPVFDIAPDSRPLNPYFTQERVPSMQEMILDGTIRKTFQMNMFRDPGDRRGHQQTWNAFDPTYGIANPNADGSTCYDDVGTSYLLQAKWFSQTELYVGGNWTKAWRLGAERLRVSDGYFSSRMVWVNDENTDITINQPRNDAKIVNGYGDINKGILGFLDGHAKYTNLIPGGESDPRRRTTPWLVPAYSNSEYTVVFPDLR